MFFSTFKAIIEILGLLGFGVLARRFSYIRDEDISRWSRFILDLLYPALAFSSIMRDLNVSRLGELWVLPLLGFGIMAIGFVVGLPLRTWLTRKTGIEQARTMHHLCIMNNYTYLPIILIGSIWGASYLPDLFLLSLGSSVGVWTMGVGVLGSARLRDTWRNLVNPNIVGILLALGLCITGIREHLPSVVINTFTAAGSGAVSCAIILTGASLAMVRFTRRPRLLILASGMRLFILPALTIAVLWLLPLPQRIFEVSVVVALMPAAVASPLFIRRFGGVEQLALQTLLVTTAISCVTVPLAMIWLF